MKVVVLRAVASRAVQASQVLEPLHQRVVHDLRSGLGLAEHECIGDVLVACGFGLYTADDAAACSRRFLDQAAQGAKPELIVLLGKETAHLAAAAGLLEEGKWKPVGLPSTDCVEITDTQEAASVVGVKLGKVPHRDCGVDLVKDARTGARLLAQAITNHRGSRYWKYGADGWRTHPRRRVGKCLLRQHLSGEGWVSVFDPLGAWPYVVIDVDRHNAIQEAHFNRVHEELRRAFPSSMFVQSSTSGGLHVYVRLPNATSYQYAARVLRAFIALKNLRFIDVVVPGDEGRQTAVRAQLVEVPNQPPRLPFGRGSRLWANTQPLDSQIREFCRFVSSPNHDDFNAAEAFVRGHLNLVGATETRTKRLLDRFLLSNEARARRVTGSLPENDPWTPVLPKLPKHLHGIVIGGIPAHGTRTRWTLALIDALLDITSEKYAQELMACWIMSGARQHASEDLEIDLVGVQEQTRSWISDAYKKTPGVPSRFWSTIEREVRRAYQIAVDPGHRPGFAKYLNGPVDFSLSEALDTAFFIARLFYRDRTKELRIHHTKFGRFVGKNAAHNMQVVLTLGPGWLTFVERATPGQRSRTFALLDVVWPPRRHERVQYSR